MLRRAREGQEASSSEPAETSGVYSVQEVARHHSPSDCWLLIHGKVYDVTKWVPYHPGGSMIFVKAGGDCSQLFDSYHPLSTR
jgi:cytochrome b involved in lipid metabolism